jgi:hypothetical protein
MKSCKDCIHYETILGMKPVCNLWLVGFDMRGYEPCEEFKPLKETSEDE